MLHSSEPKIGKLRKRKTSSEAIQSTSRARENSYQSSHESASTTPPEEERKIRINWTGVNVKPVHSIRKCVWKTPTRNTPRKAPRTSRRQAEKRKATSQRPGRKLKENLQLTPAEQYHSAKRIDHNEYEVIDSQHATIS